MKLSQFKYTTFLVCLLAVLTSQAQVKVQATPTGKHAEAIRYGKQSQAVAKARKQQVKAYHRQLKEHKKAKKYFKKRYNRARANRMDSLGLKSFSKKDSLAITHQILKEPNFPPTYKALILTPPTLDLPGLRPTNSDLDSTLLKKSEKLAEQVITEYLPEELGQQTNPLDELTNPAGATTPTLGANARPTNPNPALIKPEAAKALFSKIDSQQFQEAQAQIQKLKGKYSELPDARFPKEGTKRDSQGSTSFFKRIYIGGNVSLASTDPLILNGSLQLGYWINKKWLAGGAITLRQQFTRRDSTSLISGDGHGFSFFTRYDIPKGFFAWTEGEFQVNRSFFRSEQRSRNSGWQQAHLLGIGRDFKLGGIQLMSVILYDFNYQNNELNARPLVFKVGVQLTRRPGPSKKIGDERNLH